MTEATGKHATVSTDPAAAMHAGSENWVRLLHRIARRYAHLPIGRKLLVCEAVIWLALARLALLFVPFRHLAARFGTIADARAPAVPSSLAEAREPLVRDVGWAVTRSARYVPFRAVCLPQAIAAQAMLRCRGVASVMHFGVMKSDGGSLLAHAWLDAGAIEVTGYPVGDQFIEVARFV